LNFRQSSGNQHPADGLAEETEADEGKQAFEVGNIKRVATLPHLQTKKKGTAKANKHERENRGAFFGNLDFFQTEEINGITNSGEQTEVYAGFVIAAESVPIKTDDEKEPEDGDGQGYQKAGPSLLAIKQYGGRG